MNQTPRRTLVVGDTHGAARALWAALAAANFNAETDRLIVLGDTLDGWREAPEILEFYRGLPPESLSYVLGNHDVCFLDWVRGGQRNHTMMGYGGAITCEVYLGVHADKLQAHYDWLVGQVEYIHDSDGRLYIHAGWDVDYGFTNPAQSSLGCYYWSRSFWEGMVEGGDHARDFREVFIGHTPTTRISPFKAQPLNFRNVWNLDTGAAFAGVVTVMDVETKAFWQSEPSASYYPGEQGRQEHTRRKQQT